MSDDQSLVIFDEDGQTFESLAKENGKRTWSARKLMTALGYEKWPTFKKVIEKAISACALLGVDVFGHFSPAVSNIEGRDLEDYSLSRFACGMVALNGDSTKRSVAAAQAYFVSLAELITEQPIEHAESMDRLNLREEISERETTLRATITAAGVESHSRFRIAGYTGMYEMDYESLRRLRGLSSSPKRSLLDFMGKDELAANLFRLALTEGRIKRERIRGQDPLEQAAFEVAQKVRGVVHEELGKYPEQLPTAQDIKELRKGIKDASAGLHPIDDLEAGRIAEREYLDRMIPEQSLDAVQGCSLCAGGHRASHNGSEKCRSGSIASGGAVAHCECEFCF